MTATFQTFCKLDAALARAGFKPTPPFWLGEVERYYCHPTARECTARVGRGGIKSTTLAKVATNEVLFGDFSIPPGERHYFAFISARRDEAEQRLRLIESYLTALGVEHSRVGDTIDLVHAPRGFKVFSATVAGVSGFRCIGAACDEVCKWRQADSAANPAAEIVTSIRAMTVTHIGKARLMFFSSPLTPDDWHSKAFDAGDNAAQIVTYAPTWVANPDVTEAQTKRLERVERVWQREYLAVPTLAKNAAFREDEIEAAFEPRTDFVRHRSRVLVVDMSSGKKDRLTYASAGWSELASGSSVLVVDDIGSIDADDLRKMGGEQALVRVAKFADDRGITIGFGDQRESLMVGAAFARQSIRFHEMTWTSSSKPGAVARLQRWLFERCLALPRHQQLRDELLSFEEKVTHDGAFTYGARGSGHDDFVALLITLALADEDRKLRGSPFSQRSGPGRDRGASGGARRSFGPSGPNSELGQGIDRLVETDGGKMRVQSREEIQRRSTWSERGGFGGF